MLAFLYLGPNQPTSKEYKRTPMLVQRDKVADGLEWLKLNYIDYADLEISCDNINSYPEDEPPVIVNPSKSMEPNVNPEVSAVNASKEDDGADDGACPFVVHGLTGASLELSGCMMDMLVEGQSWPKRHFEGIQLKWSRFCAGLRGLLCYTTSLPAKNATL